MAKSMLKRLLKLLRLQGERCFYCGLPATQQDANVDHVIPRSAGGVNRLHNQVAAHVSCNLIKGNRMPTKEELLRVRFLHKEFHKPHGPLVERLRKKSPSALKGGLD